MGELHFKICKKTVLQAEDCLFWHTFQMQANFQFVGKIHTLYQTVWLLIMAKSMEFKL